MVQEQTGGPLLATKSLTEQMNENFLASHHRERKIGNKVLFPGGVVARYLPMFF